MDQAQPEQARPEQDASAQQQSHPSGGTRVLTAFGETPEQIRTELHKALGRFEETLRQEQAHWLAAPAEGRWSPAQVTEHVTIVNEGVARILNLLLSDKPLRNVPAEPGRTQDGKRLAPAALEPGEGQPWAELHPRWQASVSLLDEAVSRLGGADLSRRYSHPFLGPIDAHDWARMVTYHTRHHRRQLTEGQPEPRKNL